MKVVTATESYVPTEDEISIFLAGGITNCWNWQQAVIDELAKAQGTDKLVVFNPRREHFPMDDPNAAQKQIEWEYNCLHQANIFSMYFASGESTQPICMYELGVHITRLLLAEKPFSAVVSMEDGYCRKQDVLIQCKLATDDSTTLTLNEHANAKTHAECILEDYYFLRDYEYEVDQSDEE